MHKASYKGEDGETNERAFLIVFSLLYSNRSQQLTDQQRLMVDLVLSGHNVYLGGIAGSGKTHVANRCLRMLMDRNLKVACTCTTGLACTLFDEDLDAKTLHSFSGIGTCVGTKEHILENVLNNENVVRNWRETEVLFIDEISMLSARTFDISNYVAQNVRNSDEPFGGLQVIATGDFLQLPPVPSIMDPGYYAFQSKLWDTSFPHSIILNKSLRTNDPDLSAAVINIAHGNCPQETEQFIFSLNRNLPHPSHFGLSYIPQIHALNEDADFANMHFLDSLPGEAVTYTSFDTGNKDLINKRCIANAHLSLKVGSEVMLIYNVNKQWRNGVRARVISFS